jgi:hypothetical protein
LPSEEKAMPKRAFVLFRDEDEFKVNALRVLAQFNNVSLVMDDGSLYKATDSKDDIYF